MRPALLLLAAACTAPDPELRVTVRLVDEGGSPVVGQLAIGEAVLEADEAGRVRVDASGPVLALASGPDHLDEPVVLGRDDVGAEVVVRLWGAERWALHAGGDVMIARRYLEGAVEGEAPLVDPSDPVPGVLAVVSDLAPAFRAADLRLLNLETVVSELPPEAAYPGKRFLLNSPPQALFAVQSLGADVVGLANNHARDWMDEGVAETLRALDEAGLPAIGAGMDEASAEAPRVVDVGGVRVGLLAWTTVDGDFVNDSYPDEDAAAPADPSEPWLWERRAWGFDGPTWSVPTAERRIGGAWRLFDAVEDELPAEERAAAWASLAAVYPELQDWVARRGHGGAASFSSARAMADIAALDAEADLVVVQLHSGFQFQTAPSAWVREVVRRCAEAGADVVIAHHPHVLQGVERVGGALVVYSLGNLVFDQDFLATFPTAFLRLVYDGDALLEARLIPLELAGYRPVPVADRGAARTVRSLWELSQLRAESDRVDGAVRTFAVGLPPGTEPLHLALERHGAVVRDAPPVAEGIELRVGRGAIVDLGVDGLVDPRLGLAPGSADGIEVGRDLFGWGHFEDVLADGLHAPGTHWSVDSEWESIEVGDTPDGLRFLRLVRSENSGADVLVRPLARTPLPRHRLWSGAAPLDPEPRYAVRFLARLTGRAPAELRLRLYHFDDTNPSEDPSSVATADVAVPLTLRGGWEEVVVDVDPAWMVDGALTANMLLPTLALGPSESPEASLDIDAFQVLELRRADAMPDRMGAWDVVHNGGDRAVRLAVPTWPLRAPR